MPYFRLNRYIPALRHGARVQETDEKLFISTVKIGNGGAQNIAHGLGIVPANVAVVCVSNAASAGVFAVVEGAHDVTNVVVTVTNNATYKVIAWA